jgi:hypothetical protein
VCGGITQKITISTHPDTKISSPAVTSHTFSWFIIFYARSIRAKCRYLNRNHLDGMAWPKMGVFTMFFLDQLFLVYKIIHRVQNMT